jgi:methylamine dehydrogenase accessory protein MauD
MAGARSPTLGPALPSRAPAGALLGSAGPKVGERAPAIELEDWSGRRLRVGGEDPEARDTLLFFVSPSCPVCKSLLPAVRSLRGASPAALRLVFASDGPREEHVAFVRKQKLDEERYVLSTPLGLAYQVGTLPYAVLLDAEGIVRAKGLVNTREHLESLFEAKEQRVASVQEFLERRRAAGGRDA